MVYVHVLLLTAYIVHTIQIWLCARLWNRWLKPSKQGIPEMEVAPSIKVFGVVHVHKKAIVAQMYMYLFSTTDQHTNYCSIINCLIIVIT